MKLFLNLFREPIWIKGVEGSVAMKGHKMKKTLKYVGAALVIASLAACNTIAGVGQDAEAAGEAIEEVAKDNGAETN